MTCLKYLLPISCVLLLGVSLWQVAVPVVVSQYLKYVLSASCIVLVVWQWRGSWRRRTVNCRPAAYRLYDNGEVSVCESQLRNVV